MGPIPTRLQPPSCRRAHCPPTSIAAWTWPRSTTRILWLHNWAGPQLDITRQGQCFWSAAHQQLSPYGLSHLKSIRPAAGLQAKGEYIYKVQGDLEAAALLCLSDGISRAAASATLSTNCCTVSSSRSSSSSSICLCPASQGSNASISTRPSLSPILHCPAWPASNGGYIWQCCCWIPSCLRGW